MKANVLTACAIASLCVVATAGQSQAQSNEDTMRRLEVKLDALAKENASLRSRLNRVEAAPRAAKPKQEQGYVGPIGKPAAEPSPQAVKEAREAYAADMAYPVKAAPVRPACAQFGGWYIGGNVGWASLDRKWVDRDAWVDNFSNDWALGTVSTNKGGVTAGGQIGYNWQSGCTLFGLELDANWADIGSTKTYTPTAGPGVVLSLNDDLKWYGSLRTRTGLIVDNLMLYVTGGVAYAKIDHVWTITDPANPTESFNAKDNRWGGVLGVGAEYALYDRWTLRTEFLYYLFKETTTSVFSPAGNQIVSFDSQDSMWVTRAALNYRF